MVYFLLGYLGSGKTSALNNMLQLASHKTAVIINDFGALDVDGMLVESRRKTCITGGSIFCSCKSEEFVAAFARVLQTDCEDIIVETSGLANPFTLVEATRLSYKLANIEFAQPKCITLIDSVSFEKLAPIVRMINMQAACADLILLNKSDLVGEQDLARLTELVKQIAPNAVVRSGSHGKLSDLNFNSVQKKLPANILDISTSKCMLSLNKGAQKAQLDEVCKKLSAVCHRIKGVVDGKIYQYCNGIGTMQGESTAEENYLILLSAGNINLNKEVEKIIIGEKWIRKM